MTAPVNSRDLIMQVTAAESRGSQAYTWDNIINKPAGGGDQVITDSEFPKGTLDGWRPWFNTSYVSVLLSTHTSVPSGATSRYVCKFAVPSPATNVVSMYAARKANTDVGSEMEGFPVAVGQQYLVSIKAAKDASFTAAYFSVGVVYYNNDASISSSVSVVAMYPTITTSWQEFTGSFTVPANAQRCWLYVTSNISAGNVFWSQLRCNRKQESAYYVDGSITANKVFITGNGSELNADPACKDISAWSMLTGSGLTIDSAVTDNTISGGSYALQSTAGVAVRAFCTEKIKLDQTKNYKVKLAMKQATTTAANAYLCIAWYDANGTEVTGSSLAPAGWGGNGSYSYWTGGAPVSTINTSWTAYSHAFGPGETAKIPATVRFFRIGVMMNYNVTAGAIVKVSGVSVQEKSDSTLVVDGAITAAKVSVTSMSAISADLGTVTAGSITLPASAASHIKAGKTSYASTAAGYYLGYDTSAHKFKIGDSTKSFSWDGTDVILSNAGVDTGTAGYVKGGKTSYASTAAGYFIGYDSSAYKLKVGNSTKYIDWDGTNFTVAGGIVNTDGLAANAVSKTNAYAGINLLPSPAFNTAGGTNHERFLAQTITTPIGDVTGMVIFEAESAENDAYGRAFIKICGPDQAVTFTDAGDTVNLTAHGLTNGKELSFTSITSTTGIYAHQYYFVVNAATDTFQVSKTAGGAAVGLTTNGSGQMAVHWYTLGTQKYGVRTTGGDANWKMSICMPFTYPGNTSGSALTGATDIQIICSAQSTNYDDSANKNSNVRDPTLVVFNTKR